MVTAIVDAAGAPVSSTPEPEVPKDVLSFKQWPDGYIYKVGTNPMNPNQLVLHTVDGRIVAALGNSVDAELICEAVNLYVKALNEK